MKTLLLAASALLVLGLAPFLVPGSSAQIVLSDYVVSSDPPEWDDGRLLDTDGDGIPDRADACPNYYTSSDHDTGEGEGNLARDGCADTVDLNDVIFDVAEGATVTVNPFNFSTSPFYTPSSGVGLVLAGSINGITGELTPGMIDSAGQEGEITITDDGRTFTYGGGTLLTNGGDRELTYGPIVIHDADGTEAGRINNIIINVRPDVDGDGVIDSTEGQHADEESCVGAEDSQTSITDADENGCEDVILDDFAVTTQGRAITIDVTANDAAGAAVSNVDPPPSDVGTLSFDDAVSLSDVTFDPHDDYVAPFSTTIRILTGGAEEVEVRSDLDITILPDADGDLVIDIIDGCPDLAAGTTDSDGTGADGNGCPDATVVDEPASDVLAIGAEATLDPLSNDTALEGVDLTVTGIALNNTAAGAVSPATGAGPFTFTPADDFSGSVEFTYTIREGAEIPEIPGHPIPALTSTEVVTYADPDRDDDGIPDNTDRCPDRHALDAIFNDADNDGIDDSNDEQATDSDPADGCPDLNVIDDAYTLPQGTTASVNATANDHGHGLQISRIDDTFPVPADPSVPNLSGGLPSSDPLEYVPPIGYVGTITFTLAIQDSQRNTDTGTFALTYTDNDADDDGVLDTDTDGDGPRVADACPATHATDGGNTDTDENGCPDLDPEDDSGRANKGDTHELDPLDNDRGHGLTVTDATFGYNLDDPTSTQPTGGSLDTTTGTGPFTFTPPADFVGTVTFTFTIQDSQGNTGTSEYVLTYTDNDRDGDGVLDVAGDDGEIPDKCPDTHKNDGDLTDSNSNDGLAADTDPADGCPDLDARADDRVMVQRGTVAELDPLANDYGHALRVTGIVLNNTAAGTVDPNPSPEVTHNGSFTFMPAPDFVGTVQLTFDIRDSQANTAQSTIDLEYTENDRDNDGVLDVAGGDGVIPDKCPDTHKNDGNLTDSDPNDGTAVDEDPIDGCPDVDAMDDSGTANKGDSAELEPLANDRGHGLMVTDTAIAYDPSATGGSVAPETGTGPFTFTPPADFVGTVTFTFTIQDSQGREDTSEYALAYTDNDPDGDGVINDGTDKCPDTNAIEGDNTDTDENGCPDLFIVNDFATLGINTVATLDPLANNRGHGMTVTGVTFLPTNAGDLDTTSGTGPFTFTPATDYLGEIVFDFAVEDSQGNPSNPNDIFTLTYVENDRDGDGVFDIAGDDGEVPDKCPDTHKNDGDLTDSNPNDGLAVDEDPIDGCPDLDVEDDIDSTTLDMDVALDPLANDRGYMLTVTGVTFIPTGAGTLDTTTGTGPFTFDPASTFVGVVTFTFEIEDGLATPATGSSTLALTVNTSDVDGDGVGDGDSDGDGEVDDKCLNTPGNQGGAQDANPRDGCPDIRAGDSTARTLAGTPVCFDPLGNSLGHGLEVVNIELVRPEEGTLNTETASCPYEFTPADGFLGDVDITVTIRDSQGNTDTATVVITVEDVIVSSSSSEHLKRPTFGLSHDTHERLVECGYSMDGQCRDVDEYHVDYEREVIETGSEHDFALKAYGADTISWFEIGFGVPEVGATTASAEALIHVEVSPDYEGEAGYSIDRVEYDNDNGVIGEDAGFEVYRDDCLPGDGEQRCVTLEITGVEFREQMYHEPFVIFVMDSQRRTATHYMNDGLLIQGESLNPAPEHVISDRSTSQGAAEQMTIYRTDKLAGLWSDGAGHVFTRNSAGTWLLLESPAADMSSACTDADSRLCDAFAGRLAAHNARIAELRDGLFGDVYGIESFDDLADAVSIYDADGDSRTAFLAERGMMWVRG